MIDREQRVEVTAYNQQRRSAVDDRAVIVLGHALRAAIARNEIAHANLADAVGGHVRKVLFEADAVFAKLVCVDIDERTLQCCSIANHDLATATDSERTLDANRSLVEEAQPGAACIFDAEGGESVEHGRLNLTTERDRPAVRCARIGVDERMTDRLRCGEWLRHDTAEYVVLAANSERARMVDADQRARRHEIAMGCRARGTVVLSDEPIALQRGEAARDLRAGRVIVRRTVARFATVDDHLAGRTCEGVRAFRFSGTHGGSCSAMSLGVVKLLIIADTAAVAYWRIVQHPAVMHFYRRILSAVEFDNRDRGACEARDARGAAAGPPGAEGRRPANVPKEDPCAVVT